MATIKLTLDTRRAKKNGTFNLVFRITSNKKFKDITTGYSVNRNEFDTISCTIINNSSFNEQLQELNTHYVNRFRTFMNNNIGSEDLEAIKSYLVNKLPDEVTVIEFWNEHIQSLHIANRSGGARVYKTALSVISKEMDLNVPFKKIGYKDLVTLETKLYQRGLSPNGMGSYFRSFKAIFNKAINYDLVPQEYYAFRKFKIKRTKTTPRVLTMDEMRNYMRLNLDKSHPLYKTWNIGRLIYMLRGINISDLLLLTQDNIVNGRIVYTRKKTGKLYNILITDQVHEILCEFKANKTLLGVLNDNEHKDKEQLVEIIIQRRKVINAQLKRIGLMLNTKEVLSTYVYRYSYANFAKQLGVPIDVISSLLGHKMGLDVTNIYLQDFNVDEIDRINQQIIDAVM
jgi:integrase/recombinase XerD